MCEAALGGVAVVAVGYRLSYLKSDGRLGAPVQKGGSVAETPERIEIPASEVAAELKRQGVGPDERVILIIEPEREIIPGRRSSRARVVAAGLSDDDIDRLVKQVQEDVEPLPG